MSPVDNFNMGQIGSSTPVYLPFVRGEVRHLPPFEGGTNRTRRKGVNPVQFKM